MTGTGLGVDLFEDVFRTLIGPVLIVDLKSLLIIKANTAAEELYLGPPGSMTNLHLSELAADPARTGDFLLQRRSFVPLRYVKRQDGKHIPVEIRIRYREDPGHPLAILAVHELADRMQERQRDTALERKYRAVFEAAPYPIILATANGSVVDGNPCAVELYGHARDTWQTLSLAELIPDQPLLGAEPLFSRPTFIAATPHLRADGSTFIAETTISYLRLSQQLHAILVVQDVTDARETLARLKAAEERWRFALEGADDEVWDWHITQGELEVSHGLPHPAKKRNLVVRRREAAWMGRVHPEDQPAVREALERTLLGEDGLFSIEFRLADGGGGYRWNSVRGKIMSRDEHGQPTRMIGTFRDVHDLRLRMEKTRRQESELAHAGRLIMLGEMASVLAHEINQPLTALNNFSSLCLRRLEGMSVTDATLVRQPLEMIRAQAQRAGEIIHRVRGFVRKGTPRPTALDLNALVQRMLEMTEFEIRSQGVRVVLDLDEKLPDVCADRIQLEQVIVNLIRNALDAMREIEHERVLTVSTALTPPLGVEVRVTDVGPGFSGTEQHQVFELFRTTKPDGLGLGLSICRSIIEAHGGELRVEAGRESGAELVFGLPISSEDGRS